MKVSIDGTEYVPKTRTEQPLRGIAYKTHNRPDQLTKALAQLKQHLPDSAVVWVVDDASDPPAQVPDWVNLYRFDTHQGIAAAGNRCLQLLMDAGVEHLWLFDDDCYVIADGWNEPYETSPEPHLGYQFADLTGPRKLKDLAEVYRDHQHVAYTGQRGCMLYYHRAAIEKVGGFDPIYGSMYEHSDLALRIHHAGLTTWPFADVIGSDKLIYSLDEHEKVERTIPTKDRQQLAKRNAQIHNARRDHPETAPTWVPYRTPRNVVLTHLLTAQPDPQRGKTWPADAKTIRAWADSIEGADPIVLVDQPLTGDPGPATVEQVPVAEGQSAYRARWTHSFRWLRAHPEVAWIWCTDGSDVEMLHQPWEQMIPGTLYVGSEPKTVADDWMRKSHPARRYQELIDNHAHKTLPNCGLVGGDRSTVLQLLHAMIREFDSLVAERFWKKEQPGTEVGDMGAFARVIYTQFADRHITGPAVHTIFRADERNAFSWWKHR